MTCNHCSDPVFPCAQELRGMEYHARVRLTRLRFAWPEETRTPEQRETVRQAFAHHALMKRVLEGSIGPFKREDLRALVYVTSA